jgi:hypothetical protein
VSSRLFTNAGQRKIGSGIINFRHKSSAIRAFREFDQTEISGRKVHMEWGKDIAEKYLHELPPLRRSGPKESDRVRRESDAPPPPSRYAAPLAPPSMPGYEYYQYAYPPGYQWDPRWYAPPPGYPAAAQLAMPPPPPYPAVPTAAQPPPMPSYHPPPAYPPPRPPYFEDDSA